MGNFTPGLSAAAAVDISTSGGEGGGEGGGGGEGDWGLELSDELLGSGVFGD